MLPAFWDCTVFGPGLNDEQLSRQAILGPLNIHRGGFAPVGAVVVFDDAGPFSPGSALHRQLHRTSCGRVSATGTFLGFAYRRRCRRPS